MTAAEAERGAACLRSRTLVPCAARIAVLPPVWGLKASEEFAPTSRVGNQTAIGGVTKFASHCFFESHWSDLNRRPLDYESSALPLSYSGAHGAEGNRTPDLCSAIAALSQLSYGP